MRKNLLVRNQKAKSLDVCCYASILKWTSTKSVQIMSQGLWWAFQGNYDPLVIYLLKNNKKSYISDIVFILDLSIVHRCAKVTTIDILNVVFESQKGTSVVDLYLSHIKILKHYVSY